MLRVLLPYVRGIGIDARWLVIDGDARFFEITKRLHNHLYGAAGDGGPLGEDEHRDYEDTLHATPASSPAWCARTTSSSCTTPNRPASWR